MLYDITRPMHAAMPVWPGDSPFELTPQASLDNGDIVNVTRIAVSAHAGTHVDAPHHFTKGGKTMEQCDLTCYWGMAQVVTIDKIGGLTPADFAHVDLSLAPRLILNTPVSGFDLAQFHENYAWPTVELIDMMGAAGIILFGTDSPSVDPFGSSDLACHHAIQRNNILILEGLLLDGVPDGLYEMVAMPLKIVGGDGSPVRAVLKAVAS